MAQTAQTLSSLRVLCCTTRVLGRAPPARRSNGGAAELAGRRRDGVGCVRLTAVAGNHLGSRRTGALVRLVAVGCGTASRSAFRIGAACTGMESCWACLFLPGCLRWRGWKGCGVRMISIGRHRLRSSGITESHRPEHLGDIVRWCDGRGGGGGAAARGQRCCRSDCSKLGLPRGGVSQPSSYRVALRDWLAARRSAFPPSAERKHCESVADRPNI